MLRHLRNAATVFFAVVAVAVCVFWVRSRNTFEVAWFVVTSSSKIGITSGDGELVVELISEPESLVEATQFGVYFMDWQPFLKASTLPFSRNFGWTGTRTGFRISAPHWFVLLLTGTLAAAPAFSWRYSLRTMLLATTLVAVVLGLVCYTVR